tara:strand:+ start:115763 stop:117601 length:1839 start_codon:yes stop_codon:yes gene_type:complete
MYILGISAYYHDAAAALIKDGEIIAAAQEERFTRVKQDARFPENAIKYCLEAASITMDDIEQVIFYEDPSLKFRRILKTYRQFFPKSIPFIIKSLPSWLSKKLYWKRNLKQSFSMYCEAAVPKNKISNTTHHRSHAASAFFASPYNESAVLVLDGVGEFDTTSLWYGNGNKLTKLKGIEFPHSIGLLYSAITSYIGFKVNSGEYKVMGLAPYGEPKYVDIIKKYLLKIDDDGIFRLNMAFFDFAVSGQMTNDKLHRLFNHPPREAESEITQFEMDVARSIQDVVEEMMIGLAQNLRQLTGSANLCMAGGVALNCVGNGKLLKAKVFDNIWIQPAAGDAGGAVGAALDYYFDVLGNQRGVQNSDLMKGSYLGPEYSDQQIKEYLDSVGANYTHYENFEDLIDIVTDKLKQEEVVGWHQGRMEFGPRSLGARSILGDSRSQKMQKNMNLKIKFRESFRPFAPAILHEYTAEYFDISVDSPYMLLVAPITESKKIVMTDGEEKLFGIEKLRLNRSNIPAVTHVDYSARVQTVHPDTNQKFYDLITVFNEKTGCPVLVNTSFNVRGEPIVCTPEDSYRCFMRTGMDILAIGNFILLKERQADFDDDEKWKDEYQLD